ncbi:MAG TPA: porin, partial [Candidatus Binatia bacterium]|nr:porin [Candidatus Binatia bacterium]
MRNQLRRAAVASAIGTLGLVAFVSPALAQSDDLKSKVQDLEQQLKILQRQVELQNEASAEKAKTTPVISAGASGFSFRSADSNFMLRVRGYLQADSRWYIDDAAAGKANDTFLL